MKRRRKRNKVGKGKQNGTKSGYFLITSRLMFRWLSLFVILGLVAYLWYSDALKVAKTFCSISSSNSCDNVIMAELDRLKGTHTFLVNVDELENKLAKANPSYAKVQVEVKFPGTVKVIIEGKSATAYLKVATGSAALVIDDDLRVVDKISLVPRGAFEIISEFTYSLGVGDVISDGPTEFAILLGRRLEDNFISFEFIEVKEGEGVWVRLSNSRLAMFDSTKDITRQVTSLQLILSKATISPEPRIIDLRFDKPVLRNK